MKRSVFFSLLVLICLTATTTAFGQKGCGLDVVGTWKVESADGTDPIFYRFSPDTTVTVLTRSGPNQNAELRELGKATYILDDPKAPKAILLKTTQEGGGLTPGTASMEIKGYDDTSITIVRSGSGQTRLVKVEPYKYFVVLAGRNGVFYDRSGPAFPMLIKMGEGTTQVDAVGIYSNKGASTFGTVPTDVYNEFMKEPHNDSDIMLRLEINGVQYARGLKILHTWERRVREGALLYPEPPMDNILLVKQVTESLNQCGEKGIRLYNLDWGIDDRISDGIIPSRIPFLYFRELKRLNESLHVSDDKFRQQARPTQHAGQ